MDSKSVSEIPVFDIPVYNMTVVEEKVAKVNKRAARIGAEPVVIERVGKITKKFRFGNDNHDTFIDFCQIRIIGKTPKLNGWTLVAVAEPALGGIVLRKFPSIAMEIPLEFRDVSPDRCDHCHTKRQRNETFIVQHDVEGWKVVGRSCLRDFTGYGNPEGIANYAQVLYDLTKEIENEAQPRESWGSGGYYSAPVRSYLKQVALWSGRHGFVTSKQSRESYEKAMESDYSFHGKEATGREVFNFFFSPHSQMNRAKEIKAFNESVTDEENAKADDLVDAAMEFGKTKFVEANDADLSDYGHNMKLMLGNDFVRIIDANTVASLIPVYQRSIQPKVDYKSSKHVGEVGKQIITPVKVVKTHDWEGQYGLVHITTLQDDDGNILTWFAPAKVAAMEVGVYKVMNAKVKRHDERNGFRSTVVTYAKFV
jgi:hypothetical protein